MLRWIVILLAGGRAFYTGWLIIVVFAAQSGMESGLGFDTETLRQMTAIPVLPFIASIIYTLAYLATGILVWQRRRLAVLCAIFAASVDIAFWVINAADPVIAHLSTELDWGAIGVRDMIFNIAAILMVAGTLRLRHRGELR